MSGDCVCCSDPPPGTLVPLYPGRALWLADAPNRLRRGARLVPMRRVERGMGRGVRDIGLAARAGD